jgi:hypothetical protein
MATPDHPISAEAAADLNGSLWAAILASGVGAFAMGLVVILNEAGIFAAPSLYGPAGGVSGRTTLAVVVWLVAWAALHRRWRNRQVETPRIRALTLLLIGLGLVAAFPPLWAIF